VIVLVDSCERYLDRKGVRRYRKSCVARSPKKGRHTATKVRRTVAMKIAIEERQGCNIAASRKKLRVISERGSVDKAEGFRLHLIQKCRVGMRTPYRGGLVPCIESAAEKEIESFEGGTEHLTS